MTTSAVNTTPRPADVSLPTGVRLRYVARGERGGPPVIFLHGYTDSSHSFSRVLPLLDECYRAYALDQRGHGDSDRPATGYTMADFAADVIAFMDALGIERAALVGHSMGSFVAQEVALAAPGRVTRLVLVGSATDVRSEAVLQLQREVNALTDPVPPVFAREFQLSTIYHPVPGDFLDRAVGESLKLPARVWREVLDAQVAVDSAPGLGLIRTRTLILTGAHDTIFPQAAREALAAGLPNATLKVYPETGHALHWERPGWFVRDLEAFLSTL